MTILNATSHRLSFFRYMRLIFFFFGKGGVTSEKSPVRNRIIKLEFIGDNFVPICEEYIYEILFKNNMLYAETIYFILYHIFNT